MQPRRGVLQRWHLLRKDDTLGSLGMMKAASGCHRVRSQGLVQASSWHGPLHTAWWSEQHVQCPLERGWRCCSFVLQPSVAEALAHWFCSAWPKHKAFQDLSPPVAQKPLRRQIWTWSNRRSGISDDQPVPFVCCTLLLARCACKRWWCPRWTCPSCLQQYKCN